MLTNFKTIIKRVVYLKELISLESSGEINAYTKSERLKIKREIEKLNKSIGGIVNLNKLPDAIFVVDLANEITAITEAKKLGIPVIGLADSNVNPDVDHPRWSQATERIIGDDIFAPRDTASSLTSI